MALGETRRRRRHNDKRKVECHRSRFDNELEGSAMTFFRWTRVRRKRFNFGLCFARWLASKWLGRPGERDFASRRAARVSPRPFRKAGSRSRARRRAGEASHLLSRTIKARQLDKRRQRQ